MALDSRPTGCAVSVLAQELQGEASAAEIVPADVSGGANTSHTILVAALRALLTEVPASGSLVDYEKAALERNVLSKGTDAARRRTLRYLKQLYLLRSDSVLFRALRDLWADDHDAQPLIAGLCALARDAVFREQWGSRPSRYWRDDDFGSLRVRRRRELSG